MTKISSIPPGLPASVPVPLWLLVARKYDGIRELLADGTLNPQVRKFFEYTHYPRAKITTTTPWCAAACCCWFEVSGVKSPFSAAAAAFEEWGIKCEPLRPGAVLVFGRHDPANPHARHVALSEGPGKSPGTVLARGGNQRNRCCVVERDLGDLVTARWPEGED